MPEQNDEPKIFVDSDWKAEAQREKEDGDQSVGGRKQWGEHCKGEGGYDQPNSEEPSEFAAREQITLAGEPAENDDCHCF